MDEQESSSSENHKSVSRRDSVNRIAGIIILYLLAAALYLVVGDGRDPSFLLILGGFVVLNTYYLGVELVSLYRSRPSSE